MGRKMNPLVSVIIPVYNVKPFLHKSLNSIIQQSYENIEIIIIDDGSNDGSVELLQSIIRQSDKQIIFKHTDNLGVSNARNIGISIAKGDYLTFLDGDDWLDNTAIEELVKIVNDSINKVDLVLFPYVREFGNRSIPRKLLPERFANFDATIFKKIYKRLIGPYNEELENPDELDIFSTSWGKLYSRGILTKPFRSYNIAEDTLFNIQNLKDVSFAVYTEKVFLHYNRQKNNSSAVTKNFKIENYKKNNELLKEIEAEIEENENYYECQERLNARKIIRLFSFMLILSTSSLTFKQKLKYADYIVKDPINKEAFKKIKKKMHFLPRKWYFFYFLIEKEKSILIVTTLFILGKLRDIKNG